MQRDGRIGETRLMNDAPAPALGLVADDVTPVEAAIPGMHITRLDRGRNETELMLVELDTMGVCIGRFDFKVSSEAGFDDGVIIGLQLDEGEGSWNGQMFDRNRLWLYGPGSEHAGASIPDGDGRGATWVTFTLPPDTAAETLGESYFDRNSNQVSIDVNLASLRTSLRDVVSQVSENAFTGEQARRAEREIREATATALAGADSTRADARSSYRVTQQCLALADDLDPIPTSSELAAAVGITDRWIRAAFARAYGVSVTEFFRARALHRARRALTAATPGSTSVTEIAMECGFWHLDRFSGYYRAHFGELPRQTLHRCV